MYAEKFQWIHSYRNLLRLFIAHMPSICVWWLCLSDWVSLGRVITFTYFICGGSEKQIHEADFEKWCNTLIWDDLGKKTLTSKTSENKASQNRKKECFYWATVTDLDENSCETDLESHTEKITFYFILQFFLLS